MADEDRGALLSEAYKRDLLPPDMKSAFEEAQKRGMVEAKPKPDSFLSRVGTGFEDPTYGTAQLFQRIRPSRIGAGDTEFGKHAQAEQESIDAKIKERESAYKAPEGIDWGRMAGNALNPLNYAGAFVGGPASALTAGAGAGLVAPTTDTEHFGAAKAKQTAIGAGVGAAFGVAGKVVGAGLRATGEWLAREYPENITSQAVQKILKRMGQDEKAGSPSATTAIQLVNAASEKGKPMTLADVGGENTRALAGNVSRQPGESRNVTKQFLEQRDEGAAQRLRDDIAKYVNGGESMHKTTEALLHSRSAASRPVYDQMRQMQGVWSPRLQQFIDDSLVKRGMARGYEIERGEALAEGRPFDPTQLGVDLDAEGNIKIIKTPNMRVLDMGKQGLDAMIADERNEITGRLSSRGVMLEKVKEAYVNEIDKLDTSGLYRQARETWSGPSKSLDAVRIGRGVFLGSPEENAAVFGKLSLADQEFARVGVADMLRERLAKTGLSGDEAKAIVKNPWMRDQLKPYFKTPADFDAFVDAVTAESKMFETKFDVRGGAQSAKRIAEDESTENFLSAGGADLTGQVATGHWTRAAHTALRMWRNHQDRKGNPKLNEQISRILFATPIGEASEIGQRLTGQYRGPPPTNPLASTAGAAEQLGSVLAPGAASALAGGGP